jgi:hypothetical protein
MTQVKLYYLKDGSPTYITTQPSGIEETKSFPWTIPNEAMFNNVQIRVEDNNDNSVKADGISFTVKSSVKITNPVGDETFNVGQQITLDWVCTGTQPVVVNL